MHFECDEVLQDEHREHRWRILGPAPGRGIVGTRTWRVRDLRPDLVRDLFLVVLNYDGYDVGRRRWDVPVLRGEFENMARSLGGNLGFFPEAVDYFRFENRHDTMPEGLRVGEPALVYALPPGMPEQVLSTPKPGVRDQEEDRLFLLSRLFHHVARVLRELHRSGSVIRQIPLCSLLRNTVTYKQYISGFETLRPMRGFEGFNELAPGLHPDRRHAAPECFAEKGWLSPRTDVYAIGRLLLEALGVKLDASPLSPYDLDRTIGGLMLPDLWRRLLLLCLAPDPARRFDNCGEAIQFIASGGTAVPSAGTGAGRAPTSTPTAAGTSAAMPSARGCRERSEEGAQIHPNGAFVVPDSNSCGDRASAPPVIAPGAGTWHPTSRPRVSMERADRPPAALLVVANLWLPHGVGLDYRRLVAEFQGRYSLTPRLCFVEETADMAQNPFHTLLRGQFRFELIPYRPATDLQVLAQNSLAAGMGATEEAVLVADGRVSMGRALGDACARRGLKLRMVWLGDDPPKAVEVMPADRFYFRKA